MKKEKKFNYAKEFRKLLIKDLRNTYKIFENFNFKKATIGDLQNLKKNPAL